MEQTGCEYQADKRAHQAQHATAEGRREIRLQYDCDGHRQPVGAPQFKATCQPIAQRHARGKPQRMPERSRTQSKIRPQCGEAASETKLPRLGGFHFFEGFRPRWSRIRDQIGRRAQLPLQSLNLSVSITAGVYFFSE